MTEKTISAEVAPRRFGVTSKKAIKITFVSSVTHQRFFVSRSTSFLNHYQQTG